MVREMKDKFKPDMERFKRKHTLEEVIAHVRDRAGKTSDEPLTKLEKELVSTACQLLEIDVPEGELMPPSYLWILE